MFGLSEIKTDTDPQKLNNQKRDVKQKTEWRAKKEMITDFL